MASSPYQDAIELLKEVHEKLGEITSPGARRNWRDDVQKLHDVLGKKIDAVDNSSANPAARNGARTKDRPGYKGTFN